MRSSLAASSVNVTAAMVLGRNAFGQHQGDAAGHDGGLAGTGTGLDQKRAVVNRDRSAPRDIIGERFQRCVHY